MNIHTKIELSLERTRFDYTELIEVFREIIFYTPGDMTPDTIRDALDEALEAYDDWPAAEALANHEVMEFEERA